MLFNSIEYFIFLPITVILYFLIPKKGQWIILLIASCFFYIYLVPYYIFFVSFTIINDYTCGLFIEKFKNKKKLFLLESIVVNLGILFFFKYFNFTNQNISHIIKIIGWNYSLNTLNILLPIGLSFYIFKSLSYVIEVYRNNYRAEVHLGIYALYILFFPEILSGPIDRPKNLLTQLHSNYEFEYNSITNGLKFIAWGLFKKVVIADRLAIIVNSVFGNINNYNGLPLLLSILFFSFQIYCDFSGYTDIAIGSGMLFGFKLIDNFNKPYLSTSISDFWRRWHISLSTWFRDYVFLTISYKILRLLKNKQYLKIKVDKWAYIISTSVTMICIGIWHGANWTFITWGLLNGFYLIISLFTKRMRRKIVIFLSVNKIPMLYKLFKIIFTFSLISISWILFRSDNINEAIRIFINILKGLFNYGGGFTFGIDHFQVILSILLILILLITEILPNDNENIIQYFSVKSPFKRWIFYYLVVSLIILFGVFGDSSFIYFKF